MRRPGPRLILGLGIPLLLIIALLAVWALDSSSASGKVPRNTTLGGRDIGKMSEDDLTATVADLADHYSQVKIQVRTPEQDYEVPAGDLGLQLDQPATVREALDLDEDTSLPMQPLVWFASFLDEREAPLEFTVDTVALEAGLGGLEGNSTPVEPELVNGSDGIGIISGSNGRRISPDGVREQILDRAQSGEEPIVVNASTTDSTPTVGDDEARAMAEEVNQATTEGLRVTAGSHQVTIPAGTARSWVGSEAADGEISLVLDGDEVTSAISEALPLATETRDATVTLEGGTVRITPSVDGERCCGPDTVERVTEALSAGQGEVTVELEVEEAAFSTEDAEALGIKEPVGTTVEWNGQPQVKSFTTYHAAGPSARVHNIQLIADTVRGTLVKPGESFSINEVVGPRTAEKGYQAAGAIANGETVQEVGGGVSQFATTMFNAAFFAGLQIDTYQAHSEHFSRYPFGREATMGHPAPDLKWTNNTPYGILVWTSHTPTSVTVTLWSTQHAYGEQTGQTTGRSGNCTTVQTERTVHLPDGSTRTDTFGARYRDPGHTSC